MSVLDAILAAVGPNELAAANFSKLHRNTGNGSFITYDLPLKRMLETILTIGTPSPDLKLLVGTSSAAVPEPHDLDILQQNLQIEQQGLILDVTQVVAQLFDRIINRAPVGIAQLRPTRQPRADAVAQIVVGMSRSRLGTSWGLSGRGRTILVWPLKTLYS